MTNDHGRNGHNRRVIPATCTQHGGATGFTNLVVSKSGSVIKLDPHAVGGCVVTLDEDQARALCQALTEWLG